MYSSFIKLCIVIYLGIAVLERVRDTVHSMLIAKPAFTLTSTKQSRMKGFKKCKINFTLKINPLYFSRTHGVSNWMNIYN